MLITDNFSALPRGPRVIALGNFDGVHRGHRALLCRTVARAKEMAGTAIAFGFKPHPAQIFGKAVPLLTTEEFKAVLLAELGIDVYFTFPFDNVSAAMSPLEFVNDVLREGAGVNSAVVGFNYTFGQHAAGDATLLKSLLTPHGVSVEIMPPVLYEGQAVSSSRIRHELAQGRLEPVAAMLGRTYSLRGGVEHGARRGRTLGFPTANIAIAADLALPPFGVYAVKVADYFGMANLGYRPTFKLDQPSLEVHLFDLVGDLYGRELEVQFFKYLRPEKKFLDLEALKRQLALDERAARALWS